MLNWTELKCIQNIISMMINFINPEGWIILLETMPLRVDTKLSILLAWTCKS